MMSATMPSIGQGEAAARHLQSYAYNPNSFSMIYMLSELRRVCRLRVWMQKHCRLVCLILYAFSILSNICSFIFYTRIVPR